MDIPFLDDDELERRAVAFLRRYKRDATIPVPIEELTENDLGICPRPIRGWEERTGSIGSLPYDMNEIIVDDDVYSHHLTRYRFTLAHELAHWELHGDYIRKEFPESEHDWKRRLLSRHPKVSTRIETQANRMAGFMLVPRQELKHAWGEAQRFAWKRGYAIDEMDEFGLSQLASLVAREFLVSGQVVEIALSRYHMIQFGRQ